MGNLGGELVIQSQQPLPSHVAMIEKRIEHLLNDLETKHGVRIHYACESGSRAWGFASPDSDYDIRFIYSHEEEAYLGVSAEKSTIELPLIGDLDPGGWDIRKAALLLGKSNGALNEWLHSPVVYRAEPGFLNRWRAVARQVFSPRAAIDHYRGLAKQMWAGKLQKERVRAKDYLYALRASLAMRWILLGKGIPPVAFHEVLEVAPAEILELIPELLAHKAATLESEKMNRLPAVDRFLEEILDPSLELPAACAPDREILDRLFRSQLTARRSTERPMTREEFTLERIRKPDLLLFDAVVGSHAYGTAVETSDEDRRGVFVAPTSFLQGLDAIEQVNDGRSDQVYYEVGRFVELLLKNNPNVLELLAIPDDCLRVRHPVFGLLTMDLFLSKRCLVTFGEYAMGQIQKARGLNKKIVNPQPESRRTLLEFCHVPEGQGSVPVVEWLADRGIEVGQCGLTSVSGTADLFALYHEPSATYRGLVSPKDPDAFQFSSVPISAKPLAWMHCNRDAFRNHCKAHREYWEWVEQRNEARYQTNAEHGRGYDSKNLLHTLRLLDMAEEIATEGVLRVRRPNRDFLLKVRAGEFDYETLVGQAEEQLERVKQAFANSSLPEDPDRAAVNQILIQIRQEFGG